jgi:hypothetical protein
MVSIRENWTQLSGTVTAVRAKEGHHGTLEVDVKVDRTHPLEGFADFLSDRVGATVTIRLKQTDANNERLVPGAYVSMRVRRGRQPDEVFAHGAHIQITRG